MGKSFFTGNETELLIGSQDFSDQIVATPTAFGLSAIQSAAYQTLNDNFADAYAIAKNTATRTKVTIETKNALKADLKLMASDLAKIIDGTPSVTDAQKISLGLSVRATPVPTPPPDVRPGMDLISMVGRIATVHVHDLASETKRGKPPGCAAANIYSFVGATYPEDPAGWNWEGASTKNTVEVLFPETVPAGAKVWICATWINRKMQGGPPSVPITTNVQGGLSTIVG